jgi:SOS-response transcriptional repressor LexA
VTELTEKQAATLKAVVKFSKKNGYPPTQRELSRVLGVTQYATRMRLAALSRKGRVRLSPNLSRGIVVIDAA